MIAVLIITALFVVICIYLFFKTEKLQRTLTIINREMAKAQKDNDILSKSIAIIAGNTEESVKNRLQRLLDNTQCQNTASALTLSKPFFNNYSFIFKACLKKKEVLHSSTKKCFSSKGNDVYQNFIDSVIKNDPQILRLWNTNNFIGFISLVEALLVKYEEKSNNA